MLTDISPSLKKWASFWNSRPGIILQWLIMQQLILGGWLLFRVQDMTQLKIMSINIFTNWNWTHEVIYILKPVLTIYVLLLAFHFWQEKLRNQLAVLRLNPVYLYSVYLFLILTFFSFGFHGETFIYFQF